jgi:hypothetical protein
MNLEDDDPDTLQLKDELDPEWVNLWHKATDKKRATTKQLTFDVIPPKKAIQQNSRLQPKKNR